jgi:ABC-type lipoprotein export system ATPase subunit
MSEIKVENLKKTYIWGEETIQVLKGITFNVKQGNFVSIVGESGSGKTTLLNLMGGLDNPDEGRIEIGGTDIAAYSEKEISQFRNRRMGFIFQFYNLLQDFSVLENVMLPHYILTHDKKKSLALAKELLVRLGLEHRLTYMPSKLSGGEQQRVAIARALINEPELILADEPTGNLDKENREKVMGLLQSLKKERGFTLVIVTHDPEIAVQGDRIIHLDYGVIRDTDLSSLSATRV